MAQWKRRFAGCAGPREGERRVEAIRLEPEAIEQMVCGSYRKTLAKQAAVASDRASSQRRRSRRCVTVRRPSVDSVTSTAGDSATGTANVVIGPNSFFRIRTGHRQAGSSYARATKTAGSSEKPDSDKMLFTSVLSWARSHLNVAWVKTSLEQSRGGTLYRDGFPGLSSR